MWHLSQTFSKLPDDAWFEKLDPLLKSYMFEHWAQDQAEKMELGRMVSILVGSFINPEQAQKMIKADNPDFSSSDEDFMKSLELVKMAAKQDGKKRRRKKVNESKLNG